MEKGCVAILECLISIREENSKEKKKEKETVEERERYHHHGLCDARVTMGHGCDVQSQTIGGGSLQKLWSYNPGASGKCCNTSWMGSGHGEQSSSWKILEIWLC